MKCKDCIHHNVCCGTFAVLEDFAETHGCDDFRKKSLFIKLPCELGEPVFVIKSVWGHPLEQPRHKIELTEYSLKHLSDGTKTYLTMEEAKGALKNEKEGD